MLGCDVALPLLESGTEAWCATTCSNTPRLHARASKTSRARNLGVARGAIDSITCWLKRVKALLVESEACTECGSNPQPKLLLCNDGDYRHPLLEQAGLSKGPVVSVKELVATTQPKPRPARPLGPQVVSM